MTEAHALSAVEAARRIKAGELTAEALMRSCLDRVEARDAAVHAWAYLDPEQAMAGAKAADAEGNPGPLAGLPVAVKDIIDTWDMPTRHGSTIYGLNRPNSDATIVVRTRGQGGVVMGKTVTTEFAWRNPGPTGNPHNPLHTPGGSSSGSAASTADYQVPLAFGTQTAGSVIRPAAYCGVVGFKPSVGTHDRTGVKELSNYLDTLGTFARSVEDVTFFDSALRGISPPPLDIFKDTPPRFGVMVPFSVEARAEALEALESGWRRAEAQGATILDVASSAGFEALADLQTVVMTGDSGRALAWEYERHPERLTRFYRDNIALGIAMSDEKLSATKARADQARETQSALFKNVDAILTLPAPGEAPLGLDFTGDPLFNRVWTILGWPCITIPTGKGPKGLPLGIQIVGPAGTDARTLAASAWLERVMR
ncbi:MAG: amidase [Alphaproteobacteria bacterium]|nr:amidase [Alphaproteobacteria bacterium]